MADQKQRLAGMEDIAPPTAAVPTPATMKPAVAPIAAPTAMPNVGSGPASSPGLPDFSKIPGLDGVGYDENPNPLPDWPQGTPSTGPATDPTSPTPAVPTSLPTPTAPAPAGPTAPTPAGPGGVTLTPTDPNDSLTTKTITPGSLADRFKLAQDRFATFANSTEPAYQAALRDANRMGAAQGRLGSGDLRTSFGDLAQGRSRDLMNSRDNLFQNALEGTIGDTWNGIGLAERQQGFQNQQQQQAFERMLQQFYAGQAGGTGSASQTGYGSQVAGQGQDALAAFNEWMRNYVPGGTPAPSGGG